MLDTENFPDEVKEVLDPVLDGTQDADVLANITQAIVERRTEAVAARAAEIDGIWSSAEEAYLGIDDENRHEFGAIGQRWSKPPSPDGPVTTDRKPGQKNVKATAFVPLTRRYTDAGAGKLIEILLPPDDRPFSFKEMPVPELIGAKDDNSPVAHDQLGAGQPIPLYRPLKPGEQPPQPPQAPATVSGAASPPTAGAASPQAMPAVQPQPGAAPPGQTPLTVADLAKEKIEQARAAAKKAEDKVFNWMLECGRTAEVRKMIFDSARIGTGVVKGPVPITKRGMMVRKDGDKGVKLLIEDKLLPATKWVDPWNCFPDPSCGEDIHDGDYFLERDFLSERQVRKLKDEPGYIATQIDKVLLEGPEKVNVASEGGENGRPGEQKKRKRFPVWYYYGTLKRSEYLALRGKANGVKDDVAAAKGLKPDQDLVYAICTLINDTVVRAIINPLESGRFPYRVFPWQRRTGSWAGIGVGEQGRTAQRMTNASTRAMLNNAGKSAGAQVVLDRSCIQPANGNWTIEPDKIWYKNTDAPAMGDVRQAFTIFNIPNVTNQMMEIINLGMKLMEESTSIPLITQGQSGPTTPDTLGATQIQNNNANQLLRTIGYTFDDYVTEAEVRDYYEWYLLDPDVPDEDKAEFEIDAHGSVALVERAIQNQAILQMGATVLNPVYGLDPKKWAEQALKTQRLDPSDFKYSPEDQQRMDQNPVKPVPVQVAETRAASAEKIAQGEQTIDKEKADNQHEQAVGEMTVKLHALTIQMDAVKADLAKVSMQLQTERELNAQNNVAGDIKHRREQQTKRQQQKPPVQAPGRAAPGHAFDQKTSQ